MRWGPPPGQRRELLEVSGIVPRARHRFMRFWRGARPSKLSVGIVNNVLNADAGNTEPAHRRLAEAVAGADFWAS